MNEFDNLAKKAGHENLYSYWVKTKGEEYANTAMQNLKNTLDFLKDR